LNPLLRPIYLCQETIRVNSSKQLFSIRRAIICYTYLYVTKVLDLRMCRGSLSILLSLIRKGGRNEPNGTRIHPVRQQHRSFV